jgi:hypothetical protein
MEYILNVVSGILLDGILALKMLFFTATLISFYPLIFMEIY